MDKKRQIKWSEIIFTDHERANNILYKQMFSAGAQRGWCDARDHWAGDLK